MKTKILTIISLFLFFTSCNKVENSDNQIIKKDHFNGYVQKGPFINGSAVTIFELDNFLNQTGKAYNTTIADNSGKYEQKNLELSSHYVLLKADGFYFNENTSAISSAQLTLYALTDLSVDSSANINLLTHLERSRIEYLVNQKNYSFKDAKKQAQKEILKIFNIEKPDIINSEKLSLINDGDDNAILLAISVIIQGNRTTSEMSELLANIITDMRVNGNLSDSTSGSKLIEDVKYLDLTKVKLSIMKRYQDIGISTSIPNFEKYIKNFIDSTKFKPAKFITYPTKSNYGINILSDSVTSIISSLNWDMKYSMAANIPVGYNLKIVLSGGIWVYRAMPNGPVNWTISGYSSQGQEFISTESGKNCDLAFQLADSSKVTIDYYENNAISPTKTKHLEVKK